MNEIMEKLRNGEIDAYDGNWALVVALLNAAEQYHDGEIVAVGEQRARELGVVAVYEVTWDGTRFNVRHIVLSLGGCRIAAAFEVTRAEGFMSRYHYLIVDVRYRDGAIMLAYGAPAEDGHSISPRWGTLYVTVARDDIRPLLTALVDIRKTWRGPYWYGIPRW